MIRYALITETGAGLPYEHDENLLGPVEPYINKLREEKKFMPLNDELMIDPMKIFMIKRESPAPNIVVPKNSQVIDFNSLRS